MTSRRQVVLPLLLSGIVCSLAVLVACSSSSNSSSGAPSTPEAGADPPAALTEGGAAEADASTDAPSSVCEGACRVTALEVDIGGAKRTLVRSQFGTQRGDGGTELHTESHRGGAPACPEVNSPTPEYTLILTPIPRGAAGRTLSERDGVFGSFLDFKGDLGLPPATKASSVNLTVVAEDTASPPRWVAFDVSATFREGEVKGHVYAEHCASMDRPSDR